MNNHVAIDFETWYSKKNKYSLRSMIAEQYCRSHFFDPYMLAVHSADQSWIGKPSDFNWAALEGRDVVAHNSYFELNVVEEMTRREWIPKVNFRSMSCTANMSAFLCNRRSLEQAADHLLQIKLDKSAREDAAEKHWPADFSPEQQKIMLQYAARDAQITWELWDKFSHQWPAIEQSLSRITIAQGMRGVQINTDLLDEYILSSHEAKSATEKQLPWLKDEGDDEDSWDGFNTKPTSSKCVSEQCRRSAIPCPPIKSEDQEGYDEWEAQYSKQHPWIIALSTWRSVNKLYKSFLTMKARLRPDGSMPFSLLYFGGHTGRWAGGGGQLNMQNMRRKPLFIRTDGLVETNERITDDAIAYHKIWGCWPDDFRHAIDFRALFIPRPGKRMIVSDLAQIEPRVVKWLAGDMPSLEMLKTGMSIYEVHARATMGWTGGKLKSENPTVYSLAKARELSLGFGAGWQKFILMANMLAGLDITADDPEFVTVADPFSGAEKKVSGYGANSKRIVKEWRDSNPKVTAVWKLLDENLKRNVGGDFEMELPNGRKMRYEKVRCERRIEPDPETKLPRSRSVYTAQIGNRRHMTYGAKIFENAVQGTARDVFSEHVVELDSRGYDVLWTSHDEAILEVDNDVTPADIEQVMSVTPDWLRGCPIAAEAKIVTKYEK